MKRTHTLAQHALMRALLRAATAAALSACGGGGGDDAPAGPPELVSSKGDASRYLGSWRSSCGSSLGTDFVMRYAIVEFVFTTVQGSTVSGTTTLHDYGTSQCFGTPTNTGGTITLKIDNSTTPVTGDDFAGMLDQVTWSSDGVAGPSHFVGFDPDDRKLRISGKTAVTTSTLSYEKQ